MRGRTFATNSDSARSESSTFPDINPTMDLGLKKDMRKKYEQLSPDNSEPATLLLKGLVCSTADILENSSSGVRAIRIGNGAKCLTDLIGGDTLYERHFYPQLVSAIRGANKRVILLSNPGTGKSMFQYYLLARYLNPSLFKDDAPTPSKIKFGSTEPPKVIVRQLVDNSIEIWFLEQHVVHVICDGHIVKVLRCFEPTTTLYFYEPMQSKKQEPCANVHAEMPPTLATVSPDISRYHEFEKIASKVYMPVFTEEELVAIGRDMSRRDDFSEELRVHYSDDKIRERFKMFNGIIRHVLPTSITSLTTPLEKRELALNSTNAADFLKGTIENTTVSHYLAV